MKKIIAVILCACLLMGCSSAFAAGKLKVQREDSLIIKDFYLYYRVYAKVSNVGDKPVMVNAGVLEVFDENGDPINSSDSVYAYAKYLPPAGYTYIRMEIKLENDSDRQLIDDYMMTITGRSSKDTITQYFPATTSYEQKVKSGWYTYDYVYITATNNTDAPVYNMKYLYALLNDEGQILYVSSGSFGSDIAIMPGSSVIVRCAVDSDYVDYFAANNLQPTVVDAIVYVDVEQK